MIYGAMNNMYLMLFYLAIVFCDGKALDRLLKKKKIKKECINVKLYQIFGAGTKQKHGNNVSDPLSSSFGLQFL